MKMTNEMSEGFGTYNFMYGIFRGTDETVIAPYERDRQPTNVQWPERYGKVWDIDFSAVP